MDLPYPTGAIPQQCIDNAISLKAAQKKAAAEIKAAEQKAADEKEAAEHKKVAHKTKAAHKRKAAYKTKATNQTQESDLKRDSNPDDHDSTIDSDETVDSDAIEDDIKKRVWYVVSTSTEAAALAKWIKYTSELVFYERATKVVAPDAAAPAKKLFFHAVEVPMSTSMRNMLTRDPQEARKLFAVKEAERFPPEEMLNRKNSEELVDAIKKIGAYWALEEEGTDSDKLPA